MLARTAVCLQKFVSSGAKEKLDELRCEAPTVVLTAESLDHT